MKILPPAHLLLSAIVSICLFETVSAQPQITSWQTADAGSYARIWPTIEDETAQKAATDGTLTSVTTWDRADYPASTIGYAFGDQTAPVYAGVLGISRTATDVYVRASGLGTHTMGPWYDNIYDPDTLHAFFPGNAAILHRFPLNTAYGPNHQPPNVLSDPWACGLFVNGVPIYNAFGGSGYVTASAVDGGPGAVAVGNGDGYWSRDAFVTEGPFSDAGNGHPGLEAYHVHANPLALRHRLGDSVIYDPEVVYTGLASRGGTQPYTENFNGEHSPIIGWVHDGLPMYGPYGFSDPNDPGSAVRRMVSGYQVRDGSNGSANLAVNGRNRLPQWVVSLGLQASTLIPAGFNGPPVIGNFPLGHYIEDYAFKGDLTPAGAPFTLYTSAASQGTFDPLRHYDLNRHNVRFCVTPEFPDGTWAYFTTIGSNGDPVYPYQVTRVYFGNPAVSSAVTAIPAGATEVFAGPASLVPEGHEIDMESDDVTIQWDAIEGGVFRLETSTDLNAGWDESAPTVTAGPAPFATVDANPSELRKFYRLARLGISGSDDTPFGTVPPGGPERPGLRIEFDYSFDIEGFFNDPFRRLQMGWAALWVGSYIEDELLAIDSSQFQGASWNPQIVHPGVDPEVGPVGALGNIVIPANTIRVYVGGSTFTGQSANFNAVTTRIWTQFWNVEGPAAWRERVFGRGQTGAVNDPALGGVVLSDVSAAYSVIRFNADRDWLDDDGVWEPSERSLFSTACHELFHVLGFGLDDGEASTTMYEGLFNPTTLQFEGPTCFQVNGMSFPAMANGSHFSLDLQSAVRNTGTGPLQDVLLRPGHNPGAPHRFPTQLDFALLRDIGWEIAMPVPGALARPAPSGKVFSPNHGLSKGQLFPVPGPGTQLGSTCECHACGGAPK